MILAVTMGDASGVGPGDPASSFMGMCPWSWSAFDLAYQGTAFTESLRAACALAERLVRGSSLDRVDRSALP